MFDVVVIGGGHAGCEAATAAARRGASVALVTFSSANIGQLSCNPSIGGVGKGHLVRELDVFDGIMARAADDSTIHRRMLNRSKGSAVFGPRVQVDRALYRKSLSHRVQSFSVSIIEGEVERMLLQSGRIAAVRLTDGSDIRCRSLVVASGTFLGGRMFRGGEEATGGRVGEPASTALADQVSELGLSEARLKTGTPPRLDGRTIDWALLERQPSEGARWTMSHLPPRNSFPQLDCAITRTNERTHDLIRASFHRSPLFSGSIEGRGPRYCPSVEDKVKRFADRASHQVFLEPEGLGNPTVYPNGVSTSLPPNVQVDFLRTILGLERATITQPGYAVEYIHIDPRRLDSRLAHEGVNGLFFAGQVNGTTGYEEAAAQGLVAGLNAAAHADDLSPVTFDRSSSYIGVMVDDLTLHGVTEPYRMMTARAEFRLHLRADNAVSRLGRQALEVGCVTSTGKKAIRARLDAVEQATMKLHRTTVPAPLTESGRERRTFAESLRRADLRGGALNTLGAVDEAMEEAIADLDYEPYLARQRAEWAALTADRLVSVPAAFSFAGVSGLSGEMIERLTAARPANLEQASRVRGITPAALSAVHFAIAKGQ